MSEWIFESSDKGKTIVRRLPHSTSDEDREIMLMPDGSEWLSIAELRRIGKMHVEEQRLRAANPQLMELWKQYRTMLGLVSGGEHGDRSLQDGV